MRKIIMFNLISLDGFFAGKKGEIDWHSVDDEFNQTAIDMMKEFDTILFGRITYRLFENYWPDVLIDNNLSENDKIIAENINRMTKVVFSKTLDTVTWNNTILYGGNVIEVVKKIKDTKGLDIVIYGSGTIVKQLSEAGLIDEYRFMLNPVILGSGKNLFEGMSDMIKLKLKNSRQFENGNILLSYKPSGRDK